MVESKHTRVKLVAKQSRRIIRILVTILLGFLLISQKQIPASDQAIIIRILDEHNNPTPARVRITGLDSIYYAPLGHKADFPLGYGGDVILDNDRRFAYVDGQFSVTLPQSPVKIEVIKGYTYLFYADTVNILSDLKTLDIRLQRWFDFPDRQWYSGDVHVHYISPETALLEMKAEDVNVCNVLTSDFTSDQANFIGKPDPVSESEHIVYVNQEYREDRLGHINLLNLKELVEPVKRQRLFQYPLNIEAADRTHAQGGHVSWSHFAAWPGLEGPLGIVMQKVDAVELLCTIDPFHEPIFVSDVVPDLRMNSGLRLWYRLLNCGLRIPATAGTDKMTNVVTVGGNRVYAAIDGDFTYQAWINAINKGRTFVTNSPLLFCKINGQEAGETVSIAPGSSIKVTAEVWTQLPIDRLELIANGQVIGETTLLRDQHHAKLTMQYTPEKSVWISARCQQFTKTAARAGVSFAQTRHKGAGPTLLNTYFGTHRPETAFAHTSPVYVILDNNPIRSPEDAEYFVQYMQNAINWLRQKGSFPSRKAKDEVLQAFNRGLKMFSELAD